MRIFQYIVLGSSFSLQRVKDCYRPWAVCGMSRQIRSLAFCLCVKLANKFFPFRVDSFLEDRQNNFDMVASPGSVSIPLMLMFCVTRKLMRHHQVTSLIRLRYRVTTDFELQICCWNEYRIYLKYSYRRAWANSVATYPYKETLIRL